MQPASKAKSERLVQQGRASVVGRTRGPDGRLQPKSLAADQPALVDILPEGQPALVEAQPEGQPEQPDTNGASETRRDAPASVPFGSVLGRLRERLQ